MRGFWQGCICEAYLNINNELNCIIGIVVGKLPVILPGDPVDESIGVDQHRNNDGTYNGCLEKPHSFGMICECKKESTSIQYDEQC